ncbi:nucleotide-binding alpha-beta plait domain-containing protein [Tanacetum coccineum]
MGSYRTKEDDVAKISTSVFITNFPESLSAKELFINVFNEERLVNNLCTVWIDRFKLHANIARFHRPPVSGNKHVKKDGEGVKQSDGGGLDDGPAIVLGDDCVRSRDLSKALLGRLKEFASLANLKMALNNEGFVDIKIKYMGEFWVMMEFNSEESTKLFRDNVSVASWFSQIIVANNDFEIDGRIAWVEVEGIPFKLWTGNTFTRIAAKWGELLDIDDQEETCFHSKRLCIYMKSGRSIVEEFKIIHRGKTYWIRANETPGWVPDFDEEPDDENQDEINSIDNGHNDQDPGSVGDDSDGEEVPETVFENEGLVNNQVEGESLDKHGDKSEDPFNIYPLLNKINSMEGNDNNSGSSLQYPPGFTPIVATDKSFVHEEGSHTDNVDVLRNDNRKEELDA